MANGLLLLTTRLHHLPGFRSHWAGSHGFRFRVGPAGFEPAVKGL